MLAPSSTASEPGAAFLTLTSVEVGYGAGLPVLCELSLSLYPARVIGLVGANGSGKSTLLQVLAGRLAPRRGQLTFGDARLGQRAARARFIGYAPQAQELDPEMTVREHLALFAGIYRLPAGLREERMGAVSEELALTSFLDRRVEQCSGGMRQRLHLALSKLHEPLLWLCDEPTRALDREGQTSLWSALSAHGRAGGTALVASHELERLEEVTDQVWVLQAGRLMADVPTAVLRERYGQLARAYEALTGASARELAGPREPGKRRR